MARYLLMLLSALLIGYSAQSQVAINITGNPPNASAMVDITSTTRGLLIPRMTQVERGLIVLPATGLLIYQTDGVPGFYYNSGVPVAPFWIPFLSSNSGWRTIGNAGISPSTNFIGTTDNNPLQFRINNLYAGQLHPGTGNSFFGLQAGLNNSTGFSNIAVGTGALILNTNRSNLVAIGDSALFNNGFGAGGINPATGNTAVGSKALFSNSTGFFNSGFGFQALYSNIIGANNAATGYQSIYSNISGNSNTASGSQALYSNTVGYSNVAIGVRALYSNTSRSGLVAVGDSALFNNGIGATGTDPASGNTAVGSKALFKNNTGFFNSAYGFQSLFNNTSGSNNVANGYQSLLQNTIGSNNTANGIFSLSTNVNGFNNTGIGSQTLFSNTSGANNTASGFVALYANTTGQGNSAIGSQALFSNTTGQGNTAAGYQALFSNNTGYSNIAIGVRALYSNTNRSGLVAVGDSALFNNGIGATGIDPATGNTAVGSKALYANTTGYQNIAIGHQAMFSNQTGFSNTATGYQALYTNHSFLNTAFGYKALFSNNLGSENTAVGYSALTSVDNGIGNTGVGAFANVSVSASGSMALGYNALCTGSNQVRIGDGFVTSIGGFVGWTNFSDGRFKKNVLDNIPGLSFIQQLRPISYTLDLHAIEDYLWPGNSRYEKMDAAQLNSFKAVTEPAKRMKEKIIYTGFIAQEVEAAAKKMGFDFSGVDAPKNERDLYGLRYAEFVVPLVKAVQELADQNTKLNDNTNSQLLVIQEQNRKIELLMQQNEKLLKQIAIINKKLNIE